MKGSSVAVIGLFLLLYILPLGVRPLCGRDEARYAEIPREMIASGDWVVPRLNGIRYFEKPPLGYWLNAASMMLFGENAFAVRLPSALAAGVSALLVFLLVRRFGGGHSAGILSSVILLTSVEAYAIGIFNVLDTLFSMFVTASMVLFSFAYTKDNPRGKMAFLTLFGIFCGLAFLTKGFIAFAIPVVAIMPFMIWEGRLKEFLKVSWAPIGIAVLVVLPWAVTIHLREPDFWRYFFWYEHIRRFLSNNAQHPEPFWFFVPVIFLGALPWTVLIPAASSGLHRKCLRDPLIRFTLCWVIFPLLFFSASRGKLGTYILLCFPPFAVLMATGVLNYLESGEKQAFSIGASCLAVLVAICAGALVVCQATGFSALKPYGEAETGKWILVATVLMTWSVLLALAVSNTEPRKKIIMFCIGPLLIMFCAHFSMPDQAMGKKAAGDFLVRNAPRVRSDTILVTGDMVCDVCWFYRSNHVLMLRKGELHYGLDYDDSKNRLININMLAELIRDSGKNRVVLITKAKEYRRYKQHLPDPEFEDSNGQFVFICY